MAADLHIHALEGITEEDLANFFSNTLGSKWFNPKPLASSDDFMAAFHKVTESPNVWIGEASWLKGLILGDEDNFIPRSVQIIHDLIDEEYPVLDIKLFDEITFALQLENQADNPTEHRERIESFLRANMGKRLFIVYW